MLSLIAETPLVGYENGNQFSAACLGLAEMAAERKSYSEDDRRKSGQFGSGYSDEKLYELVRAVVIRVDPIDPVSVSQPLFDLESPAVAADNDWPKPPTARAIAMRLKKSWQKIKEEATEDRNIQQVLARADGGDMAPWFDERYIHFALHRVALHLEKTTLLPHEYERGRHEEQSSQRPSA